MPNSPPSEIPIRPVSCPSRFLPVALAATLVFAAQSASAQQAAPARAPMVGYTLGSPPPPSPFQAAPAGYPSFSAPPGVVEAPPSQVPDAPMAREMKDEGPAFDLGVATELPLMVGAQATVELPYRFLLQGEAGVLPGAFVDAVDSALTAGGAYDASTSELVRSGLRGSMILRFSGGWRPFPGHGFEMMGGYTLASFGGGVSARQAVQTATGAALPSEIPDADIQIRSTIHSVHVSLGWRWVIADHFVIRASLAYLQSVSSSSHLEVPSTLQSVPAVATRIDQVNQTIDSTLNDTYTKYVKLPVFGLSMGYRF